MWQVRWKYSCAMLRLTGRRRRYVGPSSISSCLRTRSSRFRLKLCSAFAAADLIALATSRAACLGENSRYARASDTFMPCTESATSLALRGVLRTNFCTAETSIVATTSLLDRRRLFGVGAMAAEVARRRELAQPVPDHVLADEDRHMLAAVVDRDRVPDHIGIDDRRTGPGANHLLVARLIHLFDLVAKGRADELARRLVRLASAIAKRRLAPRGLGVATWTRLALSATVRMVAGIHGRAA